SLKNSNGKINVGPMSARADTTTIGPNQSVNAQEIEAFDWLNAQGHLIEVRLVPDASSYSWQDARQKLKSGADDDYRSGINWRALLSGGTQQPLAPGPDWRLVSNYPASGIGHAGWPDPRGCENRDHDWRGGSGSLYRHGHARRLNARRPEFCGLSGDRAGYSFRKRAGSGGRAGGNHRYCRNDSV